MPLPYDKPIADFIAGLNATGHVGHSGYPTHQKFHKTSVTIHHNGGNLTLAGCLSVWTTRPASAHFQVDARGNIGQYVEVDEYAWAVGDVTGNESSISIETADDVLNPWHTADVTWKEAARLAGYLHAHVLGFRPTDQSILPHRHWSATDCPGPYILSIFPQIITEAQTWYDHFKSGSTPPSPTPTPPRLTLQQVAQQVIAGKWGNGPDRVAKLKAAGYDPVAVQNEVNKELGHTAGQKDIVTLAREVIAGKWGNGQARFDALTKAGYNPVTVQAEVNRLLA
jgi:hypothetical protein